MNNLNEQARIGDQNAFEQIVQETFIKAFKSIHQVKEPAYFSTWLCKILIRQCLHYLNQKKQALQLEFDLQKVQMMQDEHSPSFDELYEALNKLKDDYKTVLILHYFYDFKVQEIATMLGKSVNTIKIQLHRGRIQMKNIMERSRTIQQKDEKTMLNELKQTAFHYISVPAGYTLTIEDIDEKEASFFWRSEHSEEDGYYITLTTDGKLLSLSQPITATDEAISIEEQQQIAEQFITAQYKDALRYYSLASMKTKPESTHFYYKQLVYGIPLQSVFCTVEIAKNGQLLNFEYKPYQLTPPSIPATFAAKEPILNQLKQSQWTAQLEYLSSDSHTVPQSGLYVVYHSTYLYHSFDAASGEDLSVVPEADERDASQQESFVPLPQVERDEPLQTIEEIIGVPPSMERIRESALEDGYMGIVWRDCAYEVPSDKSMNQFVRDRFEHTVKATVNEETGELRGFVWFKERTGHLALSFEQCETIALKFINTYYPAFVPYFQMKVNDADFDEEHRAFFRFQLVVGNMPIEGEFFMLSVNKTTGVIDMLMASKIDVNVLTKFKCQPLLPIEQAKECLQDVDAVLEWDKRYELDEPAEILIYQFKERTSQLPIKYINATTGELILMKEG